MKTTAVFLLLISSLCSCVAALDANLESALAKKYEHTVLILRRPIDSQRQQYNSAGELLSGGTEAPWTVHGAIEIKKVRLTPGKLSIEGKQRVYGFDVNRNRLLPFKVKDRDKPTVKLEITLAAPLSSLEEGDAILHRIFTSNEQELISSAPDFWRPFLTKTYGKAEAPKSLPNASDSRPPLMPVPSAPSNNGELSPLRVDNKLVKPPKPIFTPEPSFSDAARNFKYQGTLLLGVIIDKQGTVRRIHIVRPLGLGLDEQAVTAVRTWKFQPATREGEPVAVEMAIEVAFKLF